MEENKKGETEVKGTSFPEGADQTAVQEKETHLLTKEEVLEADDLISEVVEVPEWGGAVPVAVMTGLERDEWEKQIVTMKQDGTREQRFDNFRAKLCAFTMRNPKGNRMFDVSEVKKLSKKSCRALDRVYAVAARLNGIGKEEEKELVKN